MSNAAKVSGKDWAYSGPTTSDGVRFMARGLAILRLIGAGDVREPTEAEIDSEMGEAAKRLGVGLS